MGQQGWTAGPAPTPTIDPVVSHGWTTGPAPMTGPPLAVSHDRAIPKRLIDLPSIGATVGGMIGGTVGAGAGGIGAVPGAAIGGAAGRGLGELATHGAEIPGAVVDVAKNLVREPVATLKGAAEGTGLGALNTAVEGAEQAAFQYAGGKVIQAGSGMAKWLMNRATTRVSAKLMQDFPDLSDTLINNALTVSKGGYGKAKMLLSLAKKNANDAVKLAEQQGAKVPLHLTEDVGESLKAALLEDAIKGKALPQSVGVVQSASQRLTPELQATFTEIDQAVAGQQPMHLSPTMADLLKRRLQQESKILYANMGNPNGPKALGMAATERADLAAQINTAIDAIAPGYKAANAEAKPLIGAVRGLKQAIRPNGNLYQAMVRPAVGAVLGEETGRRTGMNPIMSGIAGAAMTSPAGMSREAILLASPQMQAVLRQLPRATALALTELLRQRSGVPESGSAPSGGPRP